MKILPSSFYERDTVSVARDLLGTIIVRNYNGNKLSGIIVETEAYCFDDDPASHAYNGLKARNAPMFGPVGYSYVYFIYGNHFCFNVVARQKTVKAGAVLIRAIEPLEGIELMHDLRGSKIRFEQLTNGPGKVTQALAINRSDSGRSLVENNDLYFLQGMHVPSIKQSCRIGISKGMDLQYRFFIADNNWVSSR